MHNKTQVDFLERTIVSNWLDLVLRVFYIVRLAFEVHRLKSRTVHFVSYMERALRATLLL